MSLSRWKSYTDMLSFWTNILEVWVIIGNSGGPVGHPIFCTIQVCELDIIFNYEKAYFMLDELLLAGEIQETSKKNVLKAIAAQDLLQEEETSQGLFEDSVLSWINYTW